MQVKILKPVSSGAGKSLHNSRLKKAYYQPGETIDFEKDIFWPLDDDDKPKANIEKVAKELEDAGYIKILKENTLKKGTAKSPFKKIDEVKK